MGIEEIIRRYNQAIREARRWGEEIGKTLEEALRKVIPDIWYTIGWEEGGVDTICLWSKWVEKGGFKGHSMEDIILNGLNLQDVIVEVNITPGFTVESKAGSKSGAGIGINWSYDY